jgi:hypothetical protein
VWLGRLLWWLSEGHTTGRNYVSFDRKAAEARVRTEQKRRERDRLKTAIWDQLVAEQLEAARSRSARQEQKTRQRERPPSATEEGERVLNEAIALLDDYAEIDAKIIIHFVETFPDSQHVARVLAVSRYQGFVSPPDTNHPRLLTVHAATLSDTRVGGNPTSCVYFFRSLLSVAFVGETGSRRRTSTGASSIPNA